jgi:DNA-binding IclR family transcriptional regulator
MSIGQRLPMYIAALGRCMAAASSLSTDALREKFSALRWENRPTFEAYKKAVNEARFNGFAVDQDHYVKGVTTVSSAIVDDANRPVMAISAVGFSAQLNKTRVKELGAFIRSRTNNISSRLGASQRLD